MKGWATPLADVPDVAFAEGMVGDGLAIDPTGTMLHAPCAGIVIGVHRAHHAVTLRADNGAEILCHIGIETVGLGGNGFTVHVADGDHVEAGTPLIEFNLDTLAHGAKSLASPILVVDTDAFRVTRRACETRLAVGDWLMDLEPVVPTATVAPSISSARAFARELTLPPGHGIHARPAAAIVACVRGFTADVELISHRGRAPATNMVALMTLGLTAGDRITISAIGADGQAALDALAWLIEHGLEPGLKADETPARSTIPVAAPVDRKNGGVTAVPGMAVGTTVHFGIVQREPLAVGQGTAKEKASLEAAITQVAAILRGRAESGPIAQREIALAHLTLLTEQHLYAAATVAVSEGMSAGAAWRAALAPDIAALRAVADTRIAGRADDLVDIERQVIAATLGADQEIPDFPDDTILIANDLLPSELMALDSARLVGLALAAGGPTSHVAIIAAARNLPMVVALGPDVLALPHGSRVILDADAGTIVRADVATEAAARTKMALMAASRAAAQANADAPCYMADGVRIEIFANLGSLADADAAMAAGAEGCGLLRTELLFIDRNTPPDEAEQTMLYEDIADRMGGNPVIIRTLDVGGDKPVRYLTIPPEENPALGLRGIRMGLRYPEMLSAQLRAILRVSPTGQCRILVPMIASVAELTEVRRLVDEAAHAIGRIEPVAIGVMIETPAAAITADLLAASADFFAIGTNDLAQYTLAMDRGNPLVAAQVDALHPAVLRMIEHTTRAAAVHGRPVGVCGGLASDLTAAPILIGLGVTELSAVPGIIPELKAYVRTLTQARCADLAHEALHQLSADAVRALVARADA
jgi:phosphoenolpyruvate-protein phosphotransferase